MQYRRLIACTQGMAAGTTYPGPLYEPAKQQAEVIAGLHRKQRLSLARTD